MRLTAVLLGLTICTSGCGGGSSGPAPVSTFDAAQALTTYLTTSIAFPGLTAKDAEGNTYVINVTMTPSAESTLNGLTYKETDQNTRITVNGQSTSVDQSLSQILYQLNPTQIAAVVSVTPSSASSSITYAISIAKGTVAVPAAGTVGTFGTFVADTYPPQLDRSTVGIQPLGTGFSLWSIQPDTPATAFACFKLTVGEDCLKINSAGEILGARFTRVAGGQILIYQ
jgi:hypothetical protein